MEKAFIPLLYLMDNNKFRTENVTLRNMQTLFGGRLI